MINLKRLGLVLVVLLWFIIVGELFTLSTRTAIFFNDPQANLLLSLIFRFGMSLIVAYLAARSYLLAGSLNTLFLAIGVLAFGLTGVAGNAMGLLGAGGAVIAVNNIGALSASLLHFTASVLTIRDRGPPQVKAGLVRSSLALGLLGVIGFTGLLTSLSFQSAFPAFLTAQGTKTQLNDLVLVLTVVLFALSSLVFMRYYSRSPSSVVYWYSLALALLATSSVSFFVSSRPGDAVSWAGRSATCLGSVYLLAAILTTFRPRATKRRQ